MNENELRTKAEERVNNTELEQYYNEIFYDWPNLDEHLKWICTAPIDEILQWCRSLD